MANTFAGIPEKYADEDTAEVVLIPVPYDGTSTWIKGANRGPSAFLEAARHMELYDIETDSEVYRKGIYLAEEIDESSSPEEMVNAVYRYTSRFLAKEKFVTVIGGEHSVTIGAVKAFSTKYEGLTILQLDAHADLRPMYEGSAYNHACTMFALSGLCNLVQVGIRSMDRSELAYVNRENMYLAEHICDNQEWIEKVIAKTSANVYITIDLDVFDPSIMPSTGTPEPGGLGWYSALKFLKTVVSERNVVGFDIVELCPSSGNKAPDFLAAKLYYKLLSYKFCH
jgi:agmatinase